MSAFEISLSNARGERARLSVRGGVLEEAHEGEAGARRHLGHPVAAYAAFEFRLVTLRARGYRLEVPEEPAWADAARMILEDGDELVGSQLLAEAMGAGPNLAALLAPVEEAARALPGTFAYEAHAGLVRRAYLADADEVGLWDGLMPPLRAADPLALGFDPLSEPLAPHTLAVHALRRLLLNPAGRFVPEVRLEVTARLEPFVEALHELGRADVVTHATLLAAPGRPLGQSLPGLVALACPASLVGRCLREPAPRLTSLVVGGRTREATRVLEGLIPERLEALRCLGLHGEPLDAEGSSACVENPLLARLRTLDLGVAGPMQDDAYAILASHHRDLAHLERLVLPAAGASPETRRLFADWPNVVWASRGRAELAELDRQTVAGAGFGGLNFA